MKSLSRTVLNLYLLILLWLVLFKFSINLPSFFDQIRSFNLVPFANYSHENLRELIYNFIVFIPFGLFLSLNFKRASFSQKLATVLLFSLTVEVIQFIFAIGIADITDVISNTAGGLIGLMAYGLASNSIDDEMLDRYINVVGVALLLLVVLVLGILFFHGVRFQRSAPSAIPRLQQ